MVQQIVYELKWTPRQIGVLYLDAMDYNGLRYWYEVIQAANKPVKK